MESLAVQLVLLLTTIIAFSSFVSSVMQLDMQRIEQTDGFNFVDASRVRVRKYNRTTPVVNGTIVYKRDLDNRYKISALPAYSRLGNNQFNEYPMKIPTQTYCEFMNNTYRDYHYILANHSSYPPVPPEGICPFPKGEYWFKDALPTTSFIPRFVPEGYWRFTITVTGPDNFNFVWVFYGRLLKDDTLLG